MNSSRARIALTLALALAALPQGARAEGPTVFAGQEIRFADLSFPTATQWYWDFDADSLADSREREPIHVFAAAGTYPVYLQVCNEHGCDEISQDVVVIDPPAPPDVIFACGFETGGVEEWGEAPGLLP